MNGGTVRPVTGKLLMGGGIKRNINGSLYGSWLFADNPERYLFGEIDFICGGGDVRDKFLVPAMRTPFSSILFDVPLDAKTGTLRKGRFITVLYLREGDTWRNAKILCQLSRGRDLIVNGEWRDDRKAEWRKWDKEWFRDRVLDAVVYRIEESEQRAGTSSEVTKVFKNIYTKLLHELR